MGRKRSRNSFWGTDEILDRHWKGVGMIPPEPSKLSSAVKLVQFEEGEEFTYEVKSSDGSTVYNVTIYSGHYCEETNGYGECEEECAKCQSCVHLASCTCPDYDDREIMCKHIHLAKMVLDNSTFAPNCKVSDVSVKPLLPTKKDFEALLQDIDSKLKQPRFKKISNSSKMEAFEQLKQVAGSV